MRVEKDQSLDEILADFDPKESGSTKQNLKGGTVTIWLSPEDKARYDRLQQLSDRRFITKVREIVRAAISKAEKRAG